MSKIFVEACFRRPTPYTPVWMMRQAGRYLKEYMEVRSKAGNFLNLCHNPKLAAEVTIQPLDIVGVDAAILFSDILVIPNEMGMHLEFLQGEGPVFKDPIKTEKIILEKIKNSEIFCSQIFLMGDNFDFLSNEIKYFKNRNKDIIELLNYLSDSFEIFYLEGNHDYNLSKIFPKIKVVKRENQPLLLKYEDKKIALSHGDNFINWHYNLYCKIIRNSYFLYFLNFLDINFFISKKIEQALENKNICHNLNYFEELVNKRVKNYTEDIVIEGHYHQAKSYKIGNQEYMADA